jgi:predicted Rossmann-fold nucleotide-binding protein
VSMRVLVTGGRDYRDAARVAAVLQAVHSKHGISAVIQGGADGADRLCAEWAWDRAIPVATVNADWENITRPGALIKTRRDGTKYDALAGLHRNERMLAEKNPDCCIAFPGGTGTAHMLGLMKKSGLPLWVIE